MALGSKNWEVSWLRKRKLNFQKDNVKKQFLNGVQSFGVASGEEKNL